MSLDKIYRWSRSALLLSLVIFAICTLVAVLAVPQYMSLYDTATYQARIVLFVVPVASILGAISGGLLILRRKATSQQPENQMQRIMHRLAPAERDYLRERLDEQLVGLGEDGELLSVDDLLDEESTS